MVEGAKLEAKELVLFDDQLFIAARLPGELASYASNEFAALWNLHPQSFQTMPQPFTGRSIPLPRWQQAFGFDYRFSGTINSALPVPEILKPFLLWAHDAIDKRLNGLLLNWYDAARQHYIGPHSDSTIGLVSETPIVTISLGASRIFRLRPRRGKGFKDFPAAHGMVLILPWNTNLNTKHEVPHRKDSEGQRISITIRAFER